MMWLLSLAKDVLGVVIKPITDLFAKKLDVDLGKYQVDGKLNEEWLKADLQLLLKQQESIGGRFMQYVFVYPLACWWIALIVDSVGQRYFNWNYDVLALPEPANTWAGYMIAFLFLVAVVKR